MQQWYFCRLLMGRSGFRPSQVLHRFILGSLLRQCSRTICSSRKWIVDGSMQGQDLIIYNIAYFMGLSKIFLSTPQKTIPQCLVACVLGSYWGFFNRKPSSHLFNLSNILMFLWSTRSCSVPGPTRVLPGGTWGGEGHMLLGII